MEVTQQEKPSGVFFDSLRTKKDWDLTIEFLCPSVVNPVADISKFRSDDLSPDNYGAYHDRELDGLFERLNRSQDPAEQVKLMRAFEKRVLDEQMHTAILLWMYRIVAYRSYKELGYPINFWRTKSGLEVDFVLSGGEVAVEVKGGTRISQRDLHALDSFAAEFKPRHALLVCTEKEERVVGAVRIVPWRIFLDRLWSGSYL